MRPNCVVSRFKSTNYRMFLEQHKGRSKRKGWIEVICGSMFSGKTEELIRRLKRAKIAGQYIEIFKPMLDKRYDEIRVVSHDANAISSTPVESSALILQLAGDSDVVGVDEAQFFDKDLPEVCEKLANKGVRVIVAGLDMDFGGRPFGPIPALLAKAEFITKVHAICMKCGDLANFSFRTTAHDEQIHIGESESYIPLCRACFVIHSETVK